MREPKEVRWFQNGKENTNKGLLMAIFPKIRESILREGRNLQLPLIDGLNKII